MAQPVRTATGQPYGAAKQQADAQRTVPLPDASTWEAPIIPLHEPTARPGQHVMDGVDVGPGRNAVEAGIPGAMDAGGREQILNTLRGVFDRYPLPGIASAIQAWTQAPSWSFDDLWVNGPDTPPAAGSPTLGPPPAAPRGGMFDPSASLDPDQVVDTRQTSAAALGVQQGAALGAAVSQVADDNPTAAGLPDPAAPMDPTALDTPQPKLRQKGPR